MTLNRVVARFSDGRMIKGETRDFYRNNAQFHVTTPDGNREKVNTEDLKAIFFVRDLDGDKNRKDDYTEKVNGVGRKMQVTFSDGEIITGYAAGYSKNRTGFYLVPANTSINNERIFVLNKSCREARFI